VVEVFFHLASKWPKWCAQTLHPFFQILNFFSIIRAPIVAPSSDDFQICTITWKGLFFLEKTLQTLSKSAYKKLMPTLCLVEVTQLRTETANGLQRYFQKQTN